MHILKRFLSVRAVDGLSASPDSALRSVMMDVDCVFTVLVLSTHQKGAAEAFV